MKLIILVTAFWGAAHCRPQYTYNPPPVIVPGGSYRPGGGGNFINGGSGGGFVGIGGGSGGGFISGGGSGSNVGIGSGPGIIGGGSTGAGGFIGGGSDISGGNFVNGGAAGGGFGSGGFGSGGGGFGSGSGGFVGGSPGTLIQKHVYVHVAPPEAEEIRPQHSINVGQSTKHYKIIFIKAPSYPTPTAQQIAIQAQNQEKTLIYVLVKKPDEVGDISIPSIAPVPPSKPEVYFIRYKTQNQVSQGSSGGGVIGGNAVIGGSGGSIGSGGVIGSSGGPVIDIGSSINGGANGFNGGSVSSGISGGSISGGVIGGGISSVGGGLSTNYGPPGQSGPY